MVACNYSLQLQACSSINIFHPCRLCSQTLNLCCYHLLSMSNDWYENQQAVLNPHLFFNMFGGNIFDLVSLSCSSLLLPPLRYWYYSFFAIAEVFLCHCCFKEWIAWLKFDFNLPFGLFVAINFFNHALCCPIPDQFFFIFDMHVCYNYVPFVPIVMPCHSHLGTQIGAYVVGRLLNQLISFLC